MQTVVFNTDVGNFRGRLTDGVINFGGIRYATAERFDKPTPFVYPDGIHDCFDPAPFCLQKQPNIETYLFDVNYDGMPQVEDPLFLSVTAPENVKRGDKLAVMVWIHGGAYRNGGCDAPYLDRSYLVKDGNVLVVGINYRLSLFGFVRDKFGNAANLGLLDMIEGLKWIHNNIAAFGGDPENVTLFGQSAGADAVRCLMLSRGTEKLYRRAIIQSDPIASMKDRADLDKDVLERVNALPADISAEELKNAAEHIAHSVDQKGNAKYMIYAPHYGVEPMVAEAEFDIRLSEIAADHDLLIGNNSREVSVYVARNRTVRKLDKCFLTKPIINTVIKQKSNEIFGKESAEFAKRYARCGGNAYYYRFTWSENKSFLGACHTLDLLPLFGGDTTVGRESAMGLSPEQIAEKGERMRAIWADFAKTGKPKTLCVPGMLKISHLNSDN